MNRSIWTYPWDVQDLGLDTVCGEIRDACGLDGISLATSYHAGRFLQPRSPRRRSYFPEDGTIYFRPTPERWADLAVTPEVASIVAEQDVFAGLLAARERSGLGVSCWTVCLHNTRLGMRHPDVVARNAFGDPSYFSLCPSNEDARAYVRTLVADLTHTWRPDRVELESPCFMDFVHGYHHEKDGVGLTPDANFLMSLCFCPACTERATRAGVPVEAARRLVRDWICEACEQEVPQARFPDFPGAGLAAFAPWPELHAFLAWRFEPVTSLVAEIREAAHPDTEVVTIDLSEGWLGGCDHAALARACDGLLICAYDMDAAATHAVLARARAAAGPDKVVGAGFRVFHPEMAGANDLAAKVAAAEAGGARAFNFYNYGLIPQPRLAWIRRAVDGLASNNVKPAIPVPGRTVEKR